MSTDFQDDSTGVEPSLPQAPVIHPGPHIGLDPQSDMLVTKRAHIRSQTHSTHSRRRATWVIVGAIFTLLTVASIYTLAVYMGYSALLGRLQNLQPLEYKGSFQFNGKDFLTPYNSRINFSGNYNPATGPHPQLKLNGDFEGHMAGHDYAGSYTDVDGLVYASISGKVMPVLRYRQAPVLYPLQNGQMYKAKLNNVLLAFVCENTTAPKQPQAARLYSLLRSTRPINTWANPVAFLNGKSVTHFKGTVDSHNFEQISQSLESLLPAGCNLGTFGFSPKDAAHMTLAYQVWAGKEQDTVELVLADSNLGARLAIKLALSYQSQPADIRAPQSSIDLNTVLMELEKRYQYSVLSGYN